MTETRWNGNQVMRAVHDAAVDGLRDGAELILAESNRHVPIEHHDLEKSGKVDVDRDSLSAAVSYGTDHAVIQHESMHIHHDPGRAAKFLENAGNAKRLAAAQAVADRIRRTLGT